MTREPSAIERIRALRFHTYRCQYVAPSGRPCAAKTGRAVYTTTGSVVAWCRPGAHEEP